MISELCQAPALIDNNPQVCYNNKVRVKEVYTPEMISKGSLS